MNKLTKVGLSALCGSLAAISSANAGEMTVTGGVDMSWMSSDGVTGNPIGMGSNLTFKGDGELDNGWTFGLTVAMLNGDAYSNTVVNIDMGGLGSLNFNQGDSGNGIDAFDDKMPTAWEEPWGNFAGTGIALVSGVGPQSNVQYKTPTVMGMTLTGAYAHDMGSGNVSDKGSAAGAEGTGRGMDVTLNVNPSFGTEILSGLNVFLGAHQTENYADGKSINDAYHGTGGFTLDIGPISLGGAVAGISTGNNRGADDVDYYKNNMFGIAFNVNDDLSLSYGKHESKQQKVNPNDNEPVTLEVESMQIAYTMGGASIRYANTDVTNSKYGTTDPEAHGISVSLAF